MAKLIIAPLAEPFENGMKPQFRVVFEVPVYGDLAGIANLLR